MPKPSRAEIEAQIAALQAELADADGGVYENPATGRWFSVLRRPGRRRATTRRRAPDGSRLVDRFAATRERCARLGAVEILRVAQKRQTDMRCERVLVEEFTGEGEMRCRLSGAVAPL